MLGIAQTIQKTLHIERQCIVIFHDITELLLKVVFNTITTQMFFKTLYVIEYLSLVVLTPNVTVLSREM
jgi:hypothetical protein